MKTMKRFLASLFAIVLGASLMAVPATAFADVQTDSTISSSISSGSYVIDGSGLLTQSDVARLNQMAQDIAGKYQVAALYVTVDSLQGYSNAEAFTDAFITAYALDKLQPNGCAVFLVCVNAAEFALVSQGDCADQLTDAQLSYISTEVNPYLGRSDWAGAGETFFGDVSQTMAGGTANSTSDVAYSGTYVTDDYGLFSDEQRASLEATATQLAQQYNMGVYLLVVDNMGSQNPTQAQRTNFATSFYRANDLGLGSGKDGILLVLAPGSRDYVTVAFGQGSYSFSDEGIASMEERVTDKLRIDNWYGGAQEYYDSIGEQLEYYSVSGKPWTEPDPLSLVLKILAMLGIPAVVAFGKVNGDKSAMKTAREQSEASNYMDAGSFKITNARDEFVNTSLVATPIPKDTGKKGGNGFGGGGWGGGGGGGFSSSGGGKF